MANQDVRQTAKAAGVKLWQVAEKLGMSDCTFSRRLRHELPEETKAELLSIISQIGKEGV